MAHPGCKGGPIREAGEHDDVARCADRVRVTVPWKAMIVGSLILTILLYALRWVT